MKEQHIHTYIFVPNSCVCDLNMYILLGNLLPTTNYDYYFLLILKVTYVFNLFISITVDFVLIYLSVTFYPSITTTTITKLLIAQ